MSIKSPLILAILVCLLAPATGCYTVRSTPLELGIPMPSARRFTVRETCPKLAKSRRVTIGDELLAFREKFVEGPGAVHPGHQNLDRLPWRGWEKTHKYLGNDAPEALIYTHKSWHRGGIGIIADDSDKTATQAAFIQVRGNRTGRRWNTEEGRPIFGLDSTVEDFWAIRFGGKRDGEFYFEIVDRVDPLKIDIVQDFYVSPEALEEGFVVRRIVMRATELDNGELDLEVKSVPQDWAFIEDLCASPE